MTLELEDVQNGHAGDWDVETIVSTSTGGRTLPGEYMRCLVLSLALTGLGYPDCWGHRGASERFPENTLASFEAAIRDGAEGIESDVHVSKDGVVLMFHDPDLTRTTNSTGKIKERNWHGEDGMQHIRTKKEPIQPIPTFIETVELLMRPENRHVRFNIDVKVNNDPGALFGLLSDIIESQESWKTVLAPRILLGLWHPVFLEPAKRLLGYCQRSYIGFNISIAKIYFWEDCDTFSVWFGALATSRGQKFREKCLKDGKRLLVWTVNDPAHMMEAVRWGVSGIITDDTKRWLDLRAALRRNYENVGARYGRGFLWTTPKFYPPFRLLLIAFTFTYHQRLAGWYWGSSSPEPLSILRILWEILLEILPGIPLDMIPRFNKQRTIK